MAFTIGTNRRNTYIAIGLGLIAVALLAFVTSPYEIENSFNNGKTLAYPNTIQTSLAKTRSRYAYVTLLAPDRGDTPKAMEDDVYFKALRLLTYQLVHDPRTRSEGIPFIVMTVPGVSEVYKERIRKDGAIIHEVEHVELPEWMSHADTKPVFTRFADMFDKLRAWELSQFDKIVFMDTDVILQKPLHAFFDTVPVQHAVQPKVQLAENEPTPPKDYIFAATSEIMANHKFPPEGGDFARYSYFNGGFFMLKPSKQIYRYLLQKLQTPNTFRLDMMEQNFLNYIHHLDGPLPFVEIDPIWHIHWATKEDYEAGVHSFHDKWWEPFHPEVAQYYLDCKSKMEGFFEAYDNFAAGS